MCRMESGPKSVQYAQPPKTSLWNLNEGNRSAPFAEIQGGLVQDKQKNIDNSIIICHDI